MYNIVTTDPLVSPATAQQLIDWARLDSDDPKVESSLLIATQLVISFLKLDLLARTYTLTYEEWPEVGTKEGSMLSRATSNRKFVIDLPYANALSITSVKVNNVLLVAADYRLIPGKPAQIIFDTAGYSDYDNAALEIVYSAGYGTNFTNVPASVIQGIVMTAGYVHARSGGCDMAQAVNMSGASQLLRPYAVMGGLVF